MNSQNASATRTTTTTEMTDDQIEAVLGGECFGSWITAEEVYEKTAHLLPGVTKERAMPTCEKIAKLHNESLELA